MPLYEYRCEDGHEFEMAQKITDEPLTVCNEIVTTNPGPRTAVVGQCGAPAKRLISKTSFTLKGGGWAAQGYGG